MVFISVNKGAMTFLDTLALLFVIVELWREVRRKKGRADRNASRTQCVALHLRRKIASKRFKLESARRAKASNDNQTLPRQKIRDSKIMISQTYQTEKLSNRNF